MTNALKNLRKSSGLTHAEAAERMGISRSQFIKLERGERKLTERTIGLAAKAFGVSRAEIIEETQENSEHGGSAIRTIPSSPVFGDRDLPVYAAAEGGAGEMVVNTDPIELVPRPWYLGNVKDGFAVLIVGDSMVPVFEPGDIAIINPRLPFLRGKDVVLVADERDGEFVATVKRLLRWTEKDWHVCQFSPHREFTLPRRKWSKALRIVGKYYGA